MFGGFDNILCVVDEGIPKIWKKLNYNGGFLRAGYLRQGTNVLPDGLNWLCYFAGSSKAIVRIQFLAYLLESPHQVDMKNVVKCYKHYHHHIDPYRQPCHFAILLLHSGSLEH